MNNNAVVSINAAIQLLLGNIDFGIADQDGVPFTDEAKYNSNATLSSFLPPSFIPYTPPSFLPPMTVATQATIGGDMTTV